MDAASKFLKQFALFLAIVLIVAAPGWAQSLVVNPNPVALTPSNQFGVTVSVTASDASAIPFTVTVTNNTTPPFFNVSPTSGTAGTTSLTVSARSVAACSINPCSGSFVVHPTSGSAADVNGSVTYSSTCGGGGAIFFVWPTRGAAN